MVLNKLKLLFGRGQIKGPHTHQFTLVDTLNILVDPKCVHCPKTLNQLNKELDALTKPLVVNPRSKFRLVKGTGNA
jgi:hypothetical protein